MNYRYVDFIGWDYAVDSTICVIQIIPKYIKKYTACKIIYVGNGYIYVCYIFDSIIFIMDPLIIIRY